MNIKRRLLMMFLMSLSAAGAAHAATFPEKPVRMVIGYGPGSSTDIIGRIVAQGLSEQWKQPVIVENRPGAAGNIAADSVAKSTGDGYTILFAQNGLAISIAANPSLPFNGTKDLLPVAGVTSTPHILVVNPNSPAKSVAELVATAKARPGKLNFGSSGIGNSDHMAGELFKVLAGIDAVHVPYKSGSLAATDLLGGQLDYYFAGMPVGLPQYKGGRLRALAVTAATRYPGTPELPTMQESGLKDYEMTLWQGVFMPGSTGPDLAGFVATSVARLLEDPAMRERLTKAGAQVAPLSAAKFNELYVNDIARWKKIIPAANIKLQ
ncbi:Bug family tripartite tricarboxylate transporter substrate binding protein [Lacisediminimonas profundi]|uniref:Bug family tripartite tricarboxylate transporter substrate binding protein n=1 Tax=Lacisediminimonas profundi TaxID=2603856 RepID=UPI00124B9D40|nr:tripartite tricarboxylate transporter substrate binding protein [Lacisediminimonas profundi]